MLRAENISLSLGNHSVLNGVSLNLAPNTVTAIMGPNGAGKTSLLRVLTGEVQQNQGQVFLNNKELNQWPTQERARTLAVLPQSSTLNFPFTVLEVVLLGRIPHNTGHKRDKEIAMAALKQVDADFMAARFYTELSGGEKQRVQLARVLTQIWEPINKVERVLFLDEPSSSLDLAHQQLLIDTVRSFSNQGLAIAMVMHDFTLTARCADQLIMLKDGQVAACGNVDEVMQVEIIKTVFGVEVEIIYHPRSGLPVSIQCL